MLNRELYLPEAYQVRTEPGYFDDTLGLQEAIVHQPEIYPVAQTLLVGTGRRRIVDVGCGNGKKLAEADVPAKLGIDFGANIAHSRTAYPGAADWHDLDLSRPAPNYLIQMINPDDVVVCSDVVEHLPDPRPLLDMLRQCYLRGALVLTSTPDRVLVRGAEHVGPPPNMAHVREWTISEYRALLLASGLPPLFLGLTFNNDRDQLLRTIISLHEPRLQRSYEAAQQRPLAIMSCFNEEDVLDEVIEDWISQGCDLHVLDNWSTDRSWAILIAAAERFGRHLSIERIPAAEPSHGSWREILIRKRDIAFCHKGRWIVHTDADEIRRSPFAAFNLADALHAVARTGWNRISFTVINHRPIDDKPFLPGSLAAALPHFEFGNKPGHFIQKKAWLQGTVAVELAESGGHVAEFDGARDCPYHFVLHHYPLRSVEHGRRKINQERFGRWSVAELESGWHHHYDELAGHANLEWDERALHNSNDQFWVRHGLHILSGRQKRGDR